jgi:hypothetical protein
MKKGGTVVLLARCPDGVAREHPEVLKYGYIPYPRVKALVDRGRIRDKSAAAHLIHGGENLHDRDLTCYLVSEGVTAREARRLGLHYLRSPQEAVDRAIARHGANARIYVHPACTFSSLIIQQDLA